MRMRASMTRPHGRLADRGVSSRWRAWNHPMWIPTFFRLLSCFSMRRLLCRASCLALFCSFVLAADADENETDIRLDSDIAFAVTNLAVRVNGSSASQASVDDTVAAILSLLQSVRNSNGNTSLRTVPYVFVGGSGAYASAGLGYVLSRALAETTLDQDSARQQSFLYEIQRALYGASGIPSQEYALIPMFASRTSDIINLLYKLDYLDGYTYTDSSELRVHDAALNAMVSNMVFDSAGVGADLSSLLSQSIGIENHLAYIRSRFEAEEALDETATSVVSRAKTAQEDEYEESLQDALDEYDSIPLPEAEDDYETEAVDPEGPTSSDVVGNLDTSVSHSALLTLTTAPTKRASSSIIPAIEIDFGRDSAFVSFCLRLNDFTNWLYPILGTFFLSLKGLAMWRTVRQASIAASASGESPIVSLSWSPL